jgi:hypothetical protein
MLMEHPPSRHPVLRITAALEFELDDSKGDDDIAWVESGETGSL